MKRFIIASLAFLPSLLSPESSAQAQDVLVIRQQITKPSVVATPVPVVEKDGRDCDTLVNMSAGVTNQIHVEILSDNVSASEALSWCESVDVPDGIGMCVIYNSYTSFRRKAVLRIFTDTPPYSGPYTGGSIYQCKDRYVTK